VIVDDEHPGAARVAVELHVGGHFRAATALSLTAPSPAATEGVQLGGATVGHSGDWRGPAQLEQRPDRAGVIVIDVSPASATLVTVA
jgi:hypothetical protein